MTLHRRQFVRRPRVLAVLIVCLIALAGVTRHQTSQRHAADSHLISVWADDAGGYSLHKATAMTPQAVQQALNLGADINARDAEGLTTLMAAAHAGDLDVVQFLLDKGADVQTQDNNGDTAVIWASGSGHVDALQRLLAKGADVNVQDNNGGTALKWAVFSGKPEIIQCLRTAGAK